MYAKGSLCYIPSHNNIMIFKYMYFWIDLLFQLLIMTTYACSMKNDMIIVMRKINIEYECVAHVFLSIGIMKRLV